MKEKYTCDYCECEFEYSDEDISEYDSFMDGEAVIVQTVCCPECTCDNIIGFV